MAKVTNAVVLISENPSVSDAIEAINKKISALKHIQESVFKTSGKITMAGGTKDIKEEKTVIELVKAFSGVIARTKAIEEAYAELGITTFPEVKVDGGTVKEWSDDIKLRISIIEQKDTLEELSKMKKEWEDLMDKEDKKALLVKKMQAWTVSNGD